MLRDWREVKRRDRRAESEAWVDSGYEVTDEIGRGIHPERLSRNFTNALRSSACATPPRMACDTCTPPCLLDAGVPVKVVSRAGSATPPRRSPRTATSRVTGPEAGPSVMLLRGGPASSGLSAWWN